MATVFLTCDQQKRFEPSKVSVDICGQHQLEQSISHYMFARYICLSLQAFEVGHLSNIEIFELLQVSCHTRGSKDIVSFCTDITATVFHLKLHGVKVVIFCWPLAKVTATVCLARAQLDGSFCLPIRQRFQPSSASAFFLAQPHHLQGCWSKSKGFHHNQTCCHNGFK